MVSLSKFMIMLPVAGVMAQAVTPTSVGFREQENAFDEFKMKFGKAYKDAAEELKRFKVFLNNMDHIFT